MFVTLKTADYKYLAHKKNFNWSIQKHHHHHCKRPEGIQIEIDSSGYINLTGGVDFHVKGVPFVIIKYGICVGVAAGTTSTRT